MAKPWRADPGQVRSLQWVGHWLWDRTVGQTLVLRGLQGHLTGETQCSAGVSGQSAAAKPHTSCNRRICHECTGQHSCPLFSYHHSGKLSLPCMPSASADSWLNRFDPANHCSSSLLVYIRFYMLWSLYPDCFSWPSDTGLGWNPIPYSGQGLQVPLILWRTLDSSHE